MQILDSIYGIEEITEPVLIELINSKGMKRLKGISQHGLLEEWYKRKTFSRYDHSIGTLILLKHLGANLTEQIAGLIHDASHTAFSHVVDWVIGDKIKEDYQDSNHLELLEKTDIPIILRKHNYNLEKFKDEKDFTLLEQNSPKLCADRIDYALREMDAQKAKEIFNNLQVYKGEIIFKDKETAEIFAIEFLKLQTENWGSTEGMAKYHILSSALKKGILKKIISLEDLHQTDQHVIEKIKASKDQEILSYFEMLKNGFQINETSEGITLKKKFRYVDPSFLEKQNVTKLTECSEEFLEKITELKKLSSKGITIEIKTQHL